MKKNKSKKTGKQPVLVVIKPDGMNKFWVGLILQKFVATKSELIAAKVLTVSRHLAGEHYQHIKDQPFYRETIEVMMGKFYQQKQVLALVFWGENAIQKCRGIAGATNPEEAEAKSVRGSFGRVTSSGIYENVVHVSSDPKEAEREIKLWFNPDEISVKLYPTKKITDHQTITVWA